MLKLNIMKYKIYFLAITVACSSSAIAFNANTSYKNLAIKQKVAAMTEVQKEARAEQIRVRVEEIKIMEKSALNKAERKTLKQELQGLNKEARLLGIKLFSSLAGIAIIIVLLIILL